MYREGLGHAGHAGSDFPENRPSLWYARLARLYVRNNRAADAIEIIDEAEREGGEWSCLDAAMLGTDVANLLAEQGFDDEAEVLRHRFPIERALGCLNRPTMR